MNKTIDLKRHIWEGWTAEDFVEDLEPLLDMIMTGRSIVSPFKDRTKLKEWCIENQPYYKKHIPEVVDYFSHKYKIT